MVITNSHVGALARSITVLSVTLIDYFLVEAVAAGFWPPGLLARFLAQYRFNASESFFRLSAVT